VSATACPRCGNPPALDGRCVCETVADEAARLARRFPFRDPGSYAHAVPKARHGAADRMAALLGQRGNKMETAGVNGGADEAPSAA
jgi:hypothetical protein